MFVNPALLIYATLFFMFGFQTAQDETDQTQVALESIVASYLTHVTGERHESMIALWNNQSPEYEQRNESAPEAWKTNDFVFQEVQTTLFEQNEDESRLVITFVQTLTDSDAGTSNEERGFLDFHFRKEGDVWKIWSLSPLRTRAEDQQALQALFAKGQQSMRLGDLDSAIEVFKQVATQSMELGVTGGIAASNGDMARIYYTKHDYIKAIEHLEVAKREYELANSPDGVTNQLLALGSVYQMLADFDTSMKHLEEALALAEQHGNQLFVSFALQNMANTAKAEGRALEAMGYAERSLAAWQLVSESQRIQMSRDPKGLDLKLTIAALMAEIGRCSEALPIATDALAIAQGDNAKDKVARAYFTLGVIYQAQGKFTKSIEVSNRCVELSEAIGNLEGMAAALGTIAIAHYESTDYVESLHYLNRSAGLFERIGHVDDFLRQLNLMGAIFERQGDHERARDKYLEVVEKASELGMVGVANIAQFNLGTLYLSMGNSEEAIARWTQAREVAHREGDASTELLAILGMASVHLKNGEIDVAETLATAAMNLASRSDSTSDRARALRLTASLCFEQEAVDDAIGFAEQALDLFKQSGQRQGEYLCLTSLGRYHHAQGDVELARDLLQQAIEIVELQRFSLAGDERQQQSFFESRLEPYQEMLKLCLAQGELEQGLAIADAAKARALGDQVSVDRGTNDAELSPDNLNRQQELREQLVAANATYFEASITRDLDRVTREELLGQLRKVRHDYETFETELLVADPARRLRQVVHSPIELSQARNLLVDEKSTLIEFAFSFDECYAFVLPKRGELRAVKLTFTDVEIAARVSELRNLIQRQSPEFHDASRHLFATLLDPLELDLKETDRLLIIPDGPLWELPFAALKPNEEQYLIESCEIAFAPSLGVLRDIRDLEIRASRTPHEDMSVLAMGNPVIGRESTELNSLTIEERERTLRTSGPTTRLKPLPEAEEEATRIAELYDETSSSVFVGTEATEERIRDEIGNHDVLHLASHAILDDSNPLYSFVLFSTTDLEGASSSEGSEDGLLEAWEIRNLDLNLDLAILSACETAGASRPGEGLMGLTWAFFVAGCPTTISSLWKVEDHATKTLMIAFHEHLRSLPSGGLPTSKAQALRLAQLSLIRGYDPTTRRLRDLNLENLAQPIEEPDSSELLHPFYWAGFVLVGDGR